MMFLSKRRTLIQKLSRCGAVRRSVSDVTHGGWRERAKARIESICSRARTSVGASRLSYLVHVGNLVALVGVSCDDMLELRATMILATSFGMAYNLLQPKPLWVPASWGVVFMTMHSVRIFQILQERSRVRFSENEEQLYEKAFMPFGFTPRSFKAIMEQSNAQFERIQPGENIVTQDWGMQHNYYVMDGTVKIKRNGNVIGRISNHPKLKKGNGEWIGQPWDRDYDFTTNRRWRITAEAASEVLVVKFNLRGFHNAIREDSARMIAADRLQIKDLWGKLRHSTSLHRDMEAKKKEKIKSLQAQLDANIFDSYVSMLQVAVSDGRLTVEEISECEAYRARHGISNDQHDEALKLVGWDLPFEPRRMTLDVK